MRLALNHRGLLPYLLAMFMNAFVDLGHKIIIQNTIFKIYDGEYQIVLTAIVNSLILLPYIALFTPAGFIADRFPKNRVMCISAWIAVLITLCITLSYYLGWFWIAFALTLALGAQAAIYSPAKYGYIKHLVGEERLTAGNGAVQAVTIVAILAGTFIFSILFEQRFALLGAGNESAILRAIAPLGWLLVINSLIELYCTYRMPQTESGNTALQFSLSNFFSVQQTRHYLHVLQRPKIVAIAVAGLTVFWAVSQVMLAAFPAFAKETLGIRNTVLLQGMLGASGIGIMIGSGIASKLSQRCGSFRVIFIGAIGFVLGLLALPLLTSALWHCINFILIGVMGALFIIPLSALMQLYARNDELGRVLAANNLVQNIAMFVFLVMTALAAAAGESSVFLLWGVAVVALCGVGYTVWQLRQINF